MKQTGFVMGVPVLLLALAGTFCRNAPAPEQPKTKAAAAPRKGAKAEIRQSYASEAEVPRGGSVLLCYSVSNAQSVTLTPEVDRVYPAYSRCVEAHPTRTTTYTFTAVGADGSKDTKTVEVKVGGMAAAAPAGFRIKYFEPQRKEDFTLLCYGVDGAVSVEITPNVLPLSSVFNGCLGVAPNEPTKYTLTAVGPGGKKLQRTLAVNPVVK